MSVETKIDLLDLNADVSEGFGPYQSFERPELYDIITSANIACGFHAGDTVLMQKTIDICQDKQVAMGAHPGYRDLIGFGRRALEMSTQELKGDLLYQVGALWALAKANGGKVPYVKLHGAWYNQAMSNADHAGVIIRALKDFHPDMGWLALANSPFMAVCHQEGVPVYSEVFADRAYTDDGVLANRKLPGAVIHNVDESLEHVKRMLFDGKVKTISGKLIPISVDSICIHGDNPQALAFAQRLRTTLENSGVRFQSFSRGGAL